jgi:predicted TIM-barrel fold metal-dependent hydrolase
VGTLPFAPSAGVVDLMIGFPRRGQEGVYEARAHGIKDPEGYSRHPAEYMFKDLPGSIGEDGDPIEVTFERMDGHNIDIGLFVLSEQAVEAKRRRPGRVALCLEVDPNDVTGSVRAIREAKADHGINAVGFFPAGCLPQVAVDDKQAYAVYATCVELDLAVRVNAGVCGPRLPSRVQHVEWLDEVCSDFPDLRIVMRHGGEPWEDLAVTLMETWPNLYYMTSAFAPKHYPRAVLDYANSGGTDKVMYAGYYPSGLTLERIFTELPGLPLRDHVWDPFLRSNAVRVFGLDRLLSD